MSHVETDKGMNEATGVRIKGTKQGSRTEREGGTGHTQSGRKSTSEVYAET